MFEIIKVLLPAFTAFLGGILAFRYKEKIENKKNIYIQINKLKLIVFSLKKLLLEDPFKDIYTTGIFLSTNQMKALKNKDDFEKSIILEEKIKREIISKYHNDEKLKYEINSFYNFKIKGSNDYCSYQLEDLKKQKDFNGIDGVDLKDIHSLPGNLPIQAMMLKFNYDKLTDWLIEHLYICKEKCSIDENEKVEKATQLIFIVLDLSKQLNAIDHNLNSYLGKKT